LKKSNWSWFLVAIGLLLITIAPTTDALLPQVVAGLTLVIAGFYFSRKSKK
jgi:hypothetical protein